MRLSRFAVAALLTVMLSAGCGDAPGIPHAVESPEDASCLVCHLEGVGGAKASPHPDSAGCVTCHIEIDEKTDGSWPSPRVVFARPSP